MRKVIDFVEVFRDYGRDFFGDVPMESVSDAEVLEVISWTFDQVHTRTIEEGTQEPEVIKELFLNRLFEKYI